MRGIAAIDVPSSGVHLCKAIADSGPHFKLVVIRFEHDNLVPTDARRSTEELDSRRKAYDCAVKCDEILLTVALQFLVLRLVKVVMGRKEGPPLLNISG